MNDLPYVLLVEDDAANRSLAARILTACDLPHALASDGAEALQLMHERTPDVVLMDLSMPGMDGWEATRLIRENPDWAGVRIVALTAHAMQGDRERAISVGCDDMLTKPYRPLELIDAIRRNISVEAAGRLKSPI